MAHGSVVVDREVLAMMTAVQHRRTLLDEGLYLRGLLASIVLHLLLVAVFVIELRNTVFPDDRFVVYSISVEGGKNLGGISQVPKDEKTAIAPPKVINEPLPPKTRAETVKRVMPKAEPPKPVSDEKAEVSLAEKPKVKKVEPPKPKPTEAPKAAQPKPKPTAAKPPVDYNREYQKAMQRYMGESSDAGGAGFGAAALGGKSMGGGVQRPPEFFIYFDRLKAHIKDKWNWYDARAALRAEVVFYMEADGRIFGVELVQSSGVAEFDASVLRALAKANPAPPPPPKVYQFYRKVNMHFDPRE